MNDITVRTAVVIHRVRDRPCPFEHLRSREPLLVEALENTRICFRNARNGWWLTWWSLQQAAVIPTVSSGLYSADMFAINWATSGVPILQCTAQIT